MQGVESKVTGGVKEQIVEFQKVLMRRRKNRSLQNSHWIWSYSAGIAPASATPSPLSQLIVSRNRIWFTEEQHLRVIDFSGQPQFIAQSSQAFHDDNGNTGKQNGIEDNKLFKNAKLAIGPNIGHAWIRSQKALY